MKKRIAVTMGDPAGIGPEIVLKALSLHPQIYQGCQPIVFGDPQILKDQMRICHLDSELHILTAPDQAVAGEPGVIDVYAVSNQTSRSGAIHSGLLAYQYIEKAIHSALDGNVSAIATAPINKEALRAASVPYLDHTEILEKRTGSAQTMTLFITGNLRIFFYTRHIAFRDIVKALNKDMLVRTLMNSHAHLQTIGINEPKLALAALNPHGGEHSMFGDEEERILRPAVEAAGRKGLEVEGPIPADSVFHLAIEGKYDGVLSLYHDQGHIAAKTYDFYRTISLTMGLPFLRTSVDHGTAEEIAGRNKANETSMVEAILAAERYGW